MSDTTTAAPTAATETSAPAQATPPPAQPAPAVEAKAAEAPAEKATEKAAPKLNPWALKPAKASPAQPVEKPTAPAAPAAQATPAQPAPTGPSPDEIVAARVRDALAPLAASTLADLSESARAAITEIAGDDPAAQLKAVAALRKSGLVTATLPVGATTTQAAPPSTTPTTNPDTEALTTYERLKTHGGGIVAEAFRVKHAAAIARARAAASGSN